MHSTPHQSIAATAHFVESERILAALPLAGKRGERDQQLQLALANAVLAIAAVMLAPADWQTIITEPGEQDTP